MKYGLFYTIGIIVLTIVSVTTSPAQMQLEQKTPLTIGVQSAPGPYYAPPSWDQKLPAASRFIILSDWDNAAVLDKETGLVWQRSPSTTRVTWPVASYNCTNLSVSNRMGWHLPTVQELGSLVDRSVASGSGARLPPGHPFMNVNVGTEYFWSATTYASGTTFVYVVSFFTGATSFLAKSENKFVWCVRGGNGVDAQ